MAVIKRILRFFLVDLPVIFILAVLGLIVGFFVLIYRFFAWLTEDDLVDEIKKCGRYSE